VVSLKEGKKQHVVRLFLRVGEEGKGAGKPRSSRLFSHFYTRCLAFLYSQKHLLWLKLHFEAVEVK